MRFTFGLALAAGLLFIPAPRADAQIAFSSGFAPGAFGYYGPRASGFYGSGYYGMGYGMPWGYNAYNSYSSMYVAPGTSYFSSGYHAPFLGNYGYGYGLGNYGYSSGYSGLGYSGLGYSGFSPFGYSGTRFVGPNTGFVTTSPYMGLSRPFAGLAPLPR